CAAADSGYPFYYFDIW
nr:immunoglobulin heavy chain junction region [Macaca mulatta]MOX58561.1 immunoglobulin heavy chain junction region [Macaca mulatta]MOX58580.1 immunoglobulin heavy chain junction region [Macaca mulatta]MOX58615.1 immunoglobulin heavy chain junction region [Macaca mulatta]MOX59044.1 immunoglobulin heavy chain junction region [Macaca mulatta]